MARAACPVVLPHAAGLSVIGGAAGAWQEYDEATIHRAAKAVIIGGLDTAVNYGAGAAGATIGTAAATWLGAEKASRSVHSPDLSVLWPAQPPAP